MTERLVDTAAPASRIIAAIAIIRIRHPGFTESGPNAQRAYLATI
jgi:hypothetical protein